MANLPKYPGVRAHGNKIRINFQINGERQFEILDLTPTARNFGVARKIRQERIDAAKFGSPEPSADELAFAVYCQRFLDESACAFSTLSDYKNSLQNHWLPAFGHMSVDQIKRRHIKQALADMTCSVKTKENRLYALSGVFRVALDDEVIEANPVLGITLKTKGAKQQEIDPFTLEEWLTIKAQLPEKSRDYFTLVWETGMRHPSEVLALTHRDVSADGKHLTISKGVVRNRLKDSTKTGKDRTILLTPAAQKIIKQLPSRFRNGPLFLTDKGEPYVDPKTFNRHWRNAVEKAGVRHRRAYNLRHSFASRSLTAGMTPAYLADYLGHSLETLLKNYAKWLPGDRDELELAKLLEQ